MEGMERIQGMREWEGWRGEDGMDCCECMYSCMYDRSCDGILG